MFFLWIYSDFHNIYQIYYGYMYIKHQSEPNIKIINHLHIQRNRHQLEELKLRERDVSKNLDE